MLQVFAQQPKTPDQIYGALFHDVQMAKIFPDGKTFVDCIPKRDPAAIVADYNKLRSNPAVKYSLQLFVEANFIVPPAQSKTPQPKSTTDISSHIKNLWKALKRNADQPVEGSSLLPLQHAYVVPGGRFREIYYWDSYFTMLGLFESGELATVENMIKNFAYLIQAYGHIPNGNRTYYLGRSQPPFFSMMVTLLAEVKGDSVFRTYLPAMEEEYRYWMDGADSLDAGRAFRRVAKLKDGTVMNRYWDDNNVPRQESYAEDVETAEKSGRDRGEMYHHLRAGAESGWDFSSRWFKDAKNITSIHTTDIIPIDLNCLLFGLEMNIARAKQYVKDEEGAHEFSRLALQRKEAILKYGWNSQVNFFTDFNFVSNKPDTMVTAAGLYPLFLRIANQSQAEKTAVVTKSRLLKNGGIVTTNNTTGQQWDAPNGWAPLQWVAVKGLENYGQNNLAKTIATRWMSINEKVFKATGKMMEKYNVVNTNLEAGGGEYPGQDGFGWTNGVYLKLASMYRTGKPASVKGKKLN
jgi:alpha,alpha-trehalase